MNHTKLFLKDIEIYRALFFDEKARIILSTEHGPLGGDEINVNKSLDKFLNFG